MRKGEIWWAALGQPFGSAPGFRRPVVILQTNSFNDSPIRTVIVAAITSNLDLAAAPGNVLCRRRDTGLSKNSVVNVSQVATIDKQALLNRVGTLAAPKLAAVEEGLRLVLGL
ncbi:MAG: type II toxin-antitoxin system PemK/MazF family toxin [Deltaproteobacteria bacterium]|nr:type II toxin-antitoxin system PemK/MazF family toxin [Deltaproteobacteria bacterium]MBI3388024.1 type II toxin-antitoxin system PemK/MazF family toxin [Deltaproteobacteria bacterium]